MTAPRYAKCIKDVFLHGHTVFKKGELLEWYEKKEGENFYGKLIDPFAFDASVAVDQDKAFENVWINLTDEQIESGDHPHKDSFIFTNKL